MPLNPTTPPMQDVPMIVAKPVNHYRIVAVLIYKPVNDDTRLEIHWQEGHDDGTVVHWKPGTKIEWALALPGDPDANPNGDEFLALLAESPNGADNYEVTKNSGYKFLVEIHKRNPAKGIPDGVVA